MCSSPVFEVLEKVDDLVGKSCLALAPLEHVSHLPGSLVRAARTVQLHYLACFLCESE